MILIKLSSSLEKFSEVNFKKGLNFIVGSRNKEISGSKDSYNGVGKSLIIELIHFCLGSNAVKALEVLGHNWCELEFEHQQCRYFIRRYFDEGQECYFNDNKISLSQLKEKLQTICFPGSDKIKGLTFRSLISRYIRRYKINYANCFNSVKNEKNQITLLNNAYLLGINPEMISSKIDNKERFSQLNSTKKSLRSDPVLIDYFKGQGSIDFKIKDLSDKLNKLKIERDAFNVSDNYSNIKDQADNMSHKIKNISNKKHVMLNRIDRINASMVNKSDVSIQDVVNLYQDIEVSLPDAAIKNLNDVLEFHNHLTVNRLNSFARQKTELESELTLIEQDYENSKNELSKLLNILSTHGALDDYNILCDEINDLERELEKTKDYKELMNKYEKEITISKKKKAEITIENQDYLANNQKLLDELMDLFRTYSRAFYTDKPSGLSINVNTKDNKLAFDIDADIEGDSSDGINEVKIFCFDMTILIKHIFDINFLFHDSRLLANMDPRQRNIWLNIISETFKTEGEMQYIASINEDVIVTMKDVATEEDKKLIDNAFSDDNIILHLTDESPETKLLGMQVNIRYDK